MTDLQQFEQDQDRLMVRAPAKLNLSLLIAGKRPDGYHEIETVMAKINWCDEILIELRSGSGIELVCTGPCWAPSGPDNLVYRAAEQILRSSSRARGVRLTLTKNVPAGSGLGSASSDAAATLAGLNEYLRLGLTREQLMAAGARLGSDVAFFLDGPLAFCTGRGETVKELHPTFTFSAYLILPKISVSTAQVYAHYIHDHEVYRTLKSSIDAHLARNRIDLVAGMCANMLESCCFRLFAELGDLKRRMQSLEVGPVCLSGSGSTMFCIPRDGASESLDDARDRIANGTNVRCVVVRNNLW